MLVAASVLLPLGWPLSETVIFFQFFPFSLDFSFPLSAVKVTCTTYFVAPSANSKCARMWYGYAVVMVVFGHWLLAIADQACPSYRGQRVWSCLSTGCSKLWHRDSSLTLLLFGDSPNIQSGNLPGGRPLTFSFPHLLFKSTLLLKGSPFFALSHLSVPSFFNGVPHGKRVARFRFHTSVMFGPWLDCGGSRRHS